MKKFLLLLALIAGFMAAAQSYNNEWINYNQSYYKFKVGSTGLYRISQSVLANAGLGATPAEHFQLWRNGKQVPIYTSIASGLFTAGDYIEFWGEANDGVSDNILYRNTDFQLSDKFSLQTDTAAFFLTVNPGSGNLRLVNTAYTIPTGQTPEPYFIHTVGNYYKEKINRGYAAVVGEYVYSSAYDQNEGWTSNDFGSNESRTTNFTGLFTYTGTGAPSSTMRVHAAGNALNARQFEVKANSTQIGLEVMDFFDYKKVTLNIPSAIINSGSINAEVKNLCTATNDRMVVALTEITYPRIFNFGGNTEFAFSLPSNPAGNYLEITGFNFGSTAPVIFDITNGKRYIVNTDNAPTLRVFLQPSVTARKLIIVSQNSGLIKQVNLLQTRNFINYSAAANQGNYLIISHPLLMNGAGSANPVEEYRAYRSSAAGGSHNARIFLVDELVDQFGFGIKKNPLAIRNFIRWARATFSMPVKNVFLIGKGVNYMQFRANENHPDIDKLAIVPTFGEPASDVLLAAEPGLNEIPQVSIGRLSAINPAEVAIYLEKVMQYEQQQSFQSPLIADKAWMKNIVHIVGASDPTLGQILNSAMDRYKNIIADTMYGANVKTFSKVSSSPVEPASSQEIYNMFEKGIGVWTYFGHSSASTLEFNLDNPSNYNNQSKYPITIVMGCNAGNMFNFNTLRFAEKETLTEKFVLANQRGSIAFLASTHFGIVHYLDIFNSRTYSAAGVSHYGKTLGEIMRESIIQTFNLTTQNDYYARFHCEQSTIHGDPALKLDVSMSKPDYVIEEQLVKINPSFVSVAENRFNVDIKLMNIGKAVNKNIVVEVKRTFPNLITQVIRRDTIPGIRYIDSLNFDVEIVPTRDKGLNRISICVDADNSVDEIYETNNCITKDVFIFEDEVRPVYPYPFSIVKNPALKLKASTANPFSLSKQYVMEIDTSEFFNSPLKVTQTITSNGGVLEFVPGLTYTDSTVYYWRVAFTPVSGQPKWNTSSFVFLSDAGPNSSDFGYNQSHFYQHTKSAFQRMVLDSNSRITRYNDITNNLFLRMGTFVTSGAVQQAALSVSVNGEPYIRFTAWFSSLVFNVFDPVSFQPWENAVLRPYTNFPADLGDGKYGSHSPMNSSGTLTKYNFEYRYHTPEFRKRMMNFMKDTIPDGYYVVVRNFTLDPNTFGGDPNFPIAYANDWKADENVYGAGNSLYHYLKNAGLTGIDSFYRPRPFGFVYKKNDPSFTPRWLFGEGVTDNPTLSVDCITPDSIGYVTSPVFGPAKAWQQLKWRGSADAAGDSAFVDVIGVKNDGTEVVVFNRLTTSQQNFDVSSINAAVYPFVKLRLFAKDKQKFTPYQLRYWRITYDPVPEGAIAPNIYFSSKDTVDVGEPFDYKVAFKNVSEVAFDSLKFKVVVTDRNNVPHIIPVPRRRPIPAFGNANDTLQIGTRISSSTLPGLNTMYIEANPDNDQLEQYHFNNFAFRNVYVKPDSLNPLLDVTFDGQHILNQDIVSSKPDILVKLKDEAKWMILDDTSLVTLQVRYPDNTIRRFYFNSDTLKFTPAGQAPNNDNTATLNFRPHFLKDGVYELIVTGRDKSNNEAGAIEYRVQFRVISKPMISNMLNYPNPFTTSTAFVFTITGSEVPQNIKIEIMTITGKIVREITKEELGTLRIGRNITDFKWDGTDQFGQKLANGVYLYRVVTNLNGRTLDKYTETGDKTDQYFNKGYGKMYLMR